jgi:hypothetical protein
MNRKRPSYIQDDPPPPARPCDRCGKVCVFAGNPTRFGPCWGEATEDREMIRGSLHRICSVEHTCEAHCHAIKENVWVGPPRRLEDWLL